MLQETGSQCVGGAIRTLGSGAVGRAIAAAQSSRFGVGGVAFRTGRSTAGPVDTVPFGAWPREVFACIGDFDVELVRNQDDELNFRLLQAGGTVWFDPAIRTDYFSCPSLRRFWRQYFQYGEYKIRVAQKRNGFASVRHLVPAAFVVATAASLLLAVARREPRWALAILGPYAIANGAASIAAARRSRAHPGRVALAYAVLHTSYGAGFLSGIWRWRRGFLPGPAASHRGSLTPDLWAGRHDLTAPADHPSERSRYHSNVRRTPSSSGTAGSKPVERAPARQVGTATGDRAGRCRRRADLGAELRQPQHQLGQVGDVRLGRVVADVHDLAGASGVRIRRSIASTASST